MSGMTPESGSHKGCPYGAVAPFGSGTALNSDNRITMARTIPGADFMRGDPVAKFLKAVPRSERID